VVYKHQHFQLAAEKEERKQKRRGRRSARPTLFLLLLEEVPVVHAVVLEGLALKQVLEDAFQIPGATEKRGEKRVSKEAPGEAM